MCGKGRGGGKGSRGREERREREGGGIIGTYMYVLAYSILNIFSLLCQRTRQDKHFVLQCSVLSTHWHSGN